MSFWRLPVDRDETPAPTPAMDAINKLRARPLKPRKPKPQPSKVEKVEKKPRRSTKSKGVRLNYSRPSKREAVE